MHEVRPRLLPDLLRARSSLVGSALALVVGNGNRELTFREWEDRSNAVAHGLLSNGVCRGDRIGLVFDETDWTDYLIAYSATHKAGAVAVPISNLLPKSQIRRILKDSGASLVCSSVQRETSFSSLRRVSLCELERGSSAELIQKQVDPSDLAEILYTSGTTGVTKGVACSHEQLLFGIVTGGEALERHRRMAVALHAYPIGTNAAQGMVRLGMHRLARVVVMPSFEPEGFASLVDQHRPSMLALVPATALMLLNWGAFERHNASSVKNVGLTGAPSPPSLLRRLAEVMPHAVIENNYTSTEAGSAGTAMRYDADRPNSVGRPNRGCKIRISDEHGMSQGPNEIGEVWLCREGAPSRTYYQDPQATAAVFVGGWCRTGDIGYLDQEGYLYLTDRSSDVVISGGHNISCIEVEAVLYEHPAVAETSVFGVSHPILGQEAAVAVVLRTPVTSDGLRAFLFERLAPYQVPHRFLFLDRLPRNAAGKVLRTELIESARKQASEMAAPRTPTEEVLLSMWKAALVLEEISVTAEFLDLGGQSIAAVQLVMMIDHVLGIQITPETVYQTKTIAGLAAQVDANAAGRRVPVVTESDTGPSMMSPRLQRVVDDFADVPKADRLRVLLDYAGRLPSLPLALAKGREGLEAVAECQVPVFIAVQLRGEHHVAIHFDVPNDAPTTRGFAAILWLALDGATTGELLATPDNFYTSMALAEVLSPARIGGMAAMLGGLKHQARRLLADSVSSSACGESQS